MVVESGRLAESRVRTAVVRRGGRIGRYYKKKYI